MKNVFQCRKVVSLCLEWFQDSTSVWMASSPLDSELPALAPGVAGEGVKRKQLEKEAHIWMHLVATAKHWLPTDLNFLCLFPALDSSPKHSPLPFLLLPDVPMEWQFFREVKVRRGTLWCPVMVFSFTVPRSDSRKWNCSFGLTSLSSYSLDWSLISWSAFLQDAVNGCGFSPGLWFSHRSSKLTSVLWCLLSYSPVTFLVMNQLKWSEERAGARPGLAHPSASSVAHTTRWAASVPTEGQYWQWSQFLMGGEASFAFGMPGSSQPLCVILCWGSYPRWL